MSDRCQTFAERYARGGMVLTSNGSIQELRQKEFSERHIDETQLVNALAEQSTQEAELVRVILCGADGE